MADLPPQRHLILILARNFASRLATAVFLVDEKGRVIFFNEAAEDLLGTRFEEGHGMSAEEYTKRFRAADERGEVLGPRETPLGIAVTRREPSHGPLRITGADGTPRRIEVTAFPLLAHAGDLVGAIAFFWERPVQEHED
ncbi:MAG: PAS domain-containing protein [Actinomycetota bacterium]